MRNGQSIVAIIDDDRAVRHAFQRLLIAAGFKVILFADGAEFLHSLRSGRPGCIVLDLMLPDMTGYEVQAHLTGMKISIPIIAVTATDAPEARRKIMEAGASAYLTKPVERADLLQAINSAIAGERHE